MNPAVRKDLRSEIAAVKEELLRKENAILCAIAFFGGLIAHGYQMFAKHPNYDEFMMMFHYGTGYASGRWLLSMMGNLIFRLDGLFSLPWLNGLLTVAFLSAAALLFVRPFMEESGKLFFPAVFMLLFVSFPSVSATMTYMFTAPYYGFSVLLVAAAFYLSVRFSPGFLPGIFLVCASMGIYQAYFCMGALFVLLYTVHEFADPEKELKPLFLSAVKKLIMLGAGMGLYLLANKVILAVKGISLSGYQNIEQMGVYPAESILAAVGECYAVFLQFFTKSILELFPFGTQRLLLLLFWILAAVLFCLRTWKAFSKKPVRLVLLLLLIAILPIGISLIRIMCASSRETIHMLMYFGAFGMVGAPLLVFLQPVAADAKQGLKKTCGVLLGVLLLFFLFQNIKFANILYLGYEVHYEEMYARFLSLETKIENVPGYDDDLPIVFAGTYTGQAPLWEQRYVDASTGMYQVSHLMNYRDMRKEIFRIWLGFEYAENAPDDALLSSAEFASMPSYPDDGSVRVIDGQVVVKFSDPGEGN